MADVYVVADEAGNFDFSLKQGATRYFVLDAGDRSPVEDTERLGEHDPTTRTAGTHSPGLGLTQLVSSSSPVRDATEEARERLGNYRVAITLDCARAGV